MSCNKLFNFNLVTQDSTDIVADFENAFFPASNLRDYRSTKTWRTPDGQLIGSVVFDFKTAEVVDSIIVVGDKLRGLGFTSMVIEANITDSWGAPLFSTTLTPDPEFNFGYKDLSLELPEYRFWRVTISGGSPFVELSHLFIGRELGIGRSVNLNWGFENRDLSSATTNRSGQKFVDIRNKQKEISVGFSILSKTEYATLQNAIDANGEHTPFWIIMDPETEISDNNGRFAGPFFLDRAPQIKNVFYGRYNINALRFVEAI